MFATSASLTRLRASETVLLDHSAVLSVLAQSDSCCGFVLALLQACWCVMDYLQLVAYRVHAEKGPLDLPAYAWAPGSNCSSNCAFKLHFPDL